MTFEVEMKTVAAEVIAIVAKRVQGRRAQVQLEDRLDDLGIESIDAVELIFDLEEKFDIRIPYNANSAEPDLATVGDVVRAIENLVAGKTRTA
jgi:acyl carrier protein